MIAPWILYCLFTSGLLALAALIAERAAGAGRAGPPLRALWTFALGGSLFLPRSVICFRACSRDRG